ncbi:MAG: (deoxy)nucleoside triphosphate pyrophosphohydrolase [Syntrophobacteraceae bacterium]
MTRKHHQVACAIIEKDGLVFSAQRNSGASLPLKWELPGGKIDLDERSDQCLRRELLEELGITIDIHASLPAHTHDYTDFSVTLHPYVCAQASGEIVLRVHADALWLPPRKLLSLDWAAATVPVIEAYLAEQVVSHRSHCCFAHNRPYFKEPVLPFDDSDDWDLHREWNERQPGKNK